MMSSYSFRVMGTKKLRMFLGREYATVILSITICFLDFGLSRKLELELLLVDV